MSFGLTRAIAARDLSIAFRAGGGWFYALMFFAVFAAMAALALGPGRLLLAPAAPAVLWLAAAFSTQFAVADIFEGDANDGFLHALAAEEESLFPYVLAKVLTVMATSALPQVVAAPIILTMYGAPVDAVIAATMVFLMGLPGIMLIALFTAALAAGLRAGGMLATLIAAPFMAPVLIFGVSAMKKVLNGYGFWSPEMLVLTALSLFFAAVIPPFTIFVLRAALE